MGGWHTTVVTTDRLAELLTIIRREGGTVLTSKPDIGGIKVTWTTPDWH